MADEIAGEQTDVLPKDYQYMWSTAGDFPTKVVAHKNVQRGKRRVLWGKPLNVREYSLEWDQMLCATEAEAWPIVRDQLRRKKRRLELDLDNTSFWLNYAEKSCAKPGSENERTGEK